MRTITLFGLKGGTGRSTATMALASAFLALGRRVRVVDATDQGWRTQGRRSATGSRPRGTALLAWLGAMRASGVGEDRLTLVGAASDARRDVADALARAASEGIDVALVDTGVHPEPAVREALGRSDLVVVPFVGSAEAAAVSLGVLDVMGEPEHVMGLATGLRGGMRARAAARAAFDPEAGLLLRTELPEAMLFADQLRDGDLAATVRALRARQADPEADEADRPGLAVVRAAEAAWAAALRLTVEVEWAAEGLCLADTAAMLPALPPAHLGDHARWTA